jgi:hypothetical protein
MAEGEAEMGNAGVEVAAEALHDRRQLTLVFDDDVYARFVPSLLEVRQHRAQMPSIARLDSAT